MASQHLEQSDLLDSPSLAHHPTHSAGHGGSLAALMLVRLALSSAILVRVLYTRCGNACTLQGAPRPLLMTSSGFSR